MGVLAMTATPTFDPDRYKETTREQWQQAAAAWQRWTPTLQTWFAPATEAMIELGKLTRGSRVLEVAAGAGEPALTFARIVGPTGYVLATDIAPNVLELARQTAAEQGLTQVDTRVMDGEQLELPDASFDAVTSRVGLIYFPNQQRALTEARRVLRVGGRIVACVYTTAEQNQFFSIPIDIIRRRAQLPPPLPGQPGPFSLGDPGVLEAAFERAGFQDVESRRIDAPLRMASAADYLRFARESFGALHQMLVGLPEAERQSVWDEIEQELRQFEGPDGFSGPCELLVAAGAKH
jgi:SAM-dependent methyltransferase